MLSYELGHLTWSELFRSMSARSAEIVGAKLPEPIPRSQGFVRATLASGRDRAPAARFGLEAGRKLDDYRNQMDRPGSPPRHCRCYVGAARLNQSRQLYRGASDHARVNRRTDRPNRTGQQSSPL